jgi:hypothetical protein
MYQRGLSALLCGMMTLVPLTNEGQEPRALRLAQRIDALGMSDRAFAKLAKTDRGTIKAAREGRSTATTYGHLESVLDDYEYEVGADAPDESVTTIELLDGRKILYRGLSPEDGAKFVTEFLRLNP